MAVFPTEAAERLVEYNSDFYDANTNPYGFADGGHIPNFPAALQDTASVIAYVAAASQEVADHAQEVVDNLALVIAARDRAQEWASKPENQAVVGGLFSALHYALKANASAQAAATFEPDRYVPKVAVSISNANEAPLGQWASFLGTEGQAVAANFPALGGSSTAPRSWNVFTFGHDTARTQILSEVFGTGTTPGRQFTRVLTNGNWQPYREVYNTATLPVPTNAEIDAGTNTLRKAFSVLDVWRAARAALPLFTQAEAEAGIVATAGSWSPQRDAQAIAALAPKGSTTAGTLGSTSVGTAGVFLASADFVATGPSCRGLINCSVEGSSDTLFSARLDLILVSNGSLVRQGSGSTILHKALGLERNLAEVEFTGLTRGATYRFRGFGNTSAGTVTVTSIVTGQCS